MRRRSQVQRDLDKIDEELEKLSRSSLTVGSLGAHGENLSEPAVRSNVHKKSDLLSRKELLNRELKEIQEKENNNA